MEPVLERARMTMTHGQASSRAGRNSFASSCGGQPHARPGLARRRSVSRTETTSSVVSAVPAGASHVHSLQTGSGACVLLAQSGGEKNVQLPFADGLPVNRRHPLHVLVHTGEAGQHVSIGVVATDSDPCFSSGKYLNLDAPMSLELSGSRIRVKGLPSWDDDGVQRRLHTSTGGTFSESSIARS